MSKATDPLVAIDQPFLAFNFGGKDNTYEEHELDRPPTGTLLNLQAGRHHRHRRSARGNLLFGEEAAALGGAYLAVKQADQERQKQRELEREVRQARRLEASAMTDLDRQKAARAVQATQGDLREFTRATGRSRDRAREHLRFADG